MIDLHNHILPGVDDGARSLDEACSMARALVARGVTVVCATPHTTEWATAGDAASVQGHVERLSTELAERAIDLRLLPGAEVYLTPHVAAQVQSRQVATLNDTHYVLIEFPYDSLPPFFERAVFELQARGFRPIIAHPERIAPIADDPNILARLIRRGCLAQLTAMSLSGGFGARSRSICELMLEHHLVQLVASDAHDAEPGGRLEAIEPARAVAAKVLGAAAERELFEDIPARIVAGERVDSPEPIDYRKRHFPFLKGFR